MTPIPTDPGIPSEAPPLPPLPPLEPGFPQTPEIDPDVSPDVEEPEPEPGEDDPAKKLMIMRSSLHYRDILDAIFRTDPIGLRHAFDVLVTRHLDVEDVEPGQLAPALEGTSRALLGDLTTMQEATRAGLSSEPRTKSFGDDYHAGASAIIRNLPAWILRLNKP